jgi:hypothetical protein
MSCMSERTWEGKYVGACRQALPPQRPPGASDRTALSLQKIARTVATVWCTVNAADQGTANTQPKLNLGSCVEAFEYSNRQPDARGRPAVIVDSHPTDKRRLLGLVLVGGDDTGVAETGQLAQELGCLVRGVG